MQIPTRVNDVISVLLADREIFLRFLVLRVGNLADAEDILQDSLAKALQKAHGLRRSERVVPWFYRLLRNAIADFYRARDSESRGKAALAQTLQASKEFAVRSTAADWEENLCRCFEGLLPTLKPRYVELLSRVDLRGEPKVVVRHEMKLSPATFDVALHRARSALRRRLEVFCGACSREACLACACEQGLRVEPRKAAGRRPRQFNELKV